VAAALILQTYLDRGRGRTDGAWSWGGAGRRPRGRHGGGGRHPVGPRGRRCGGDPAPGRGARTWCPEERSEGIVTAKDGQEPAVTRLGCAPWPRPGRS